MRVGRGIGVPLRTEALPNSEYPNDRDVNEKAASSNGWGSGPAAVGRICRNRKVGMGKWGSWLGKAELLSATKLQDSELHPERRVLFCS